MIVYSVLLCSLIAFASCQKSKSWKDASILNEARYLAAGGQFGAAYKQDDGVEFKEEADNAGNRRGSYSYVDPNGVRRTVSYTAGVDGFKPTGDHLPAGAAVNGAPVAQAAPAVPVASYVASGAQHTPGNGPALDSGFYNPDFDYPDDTKNADNGQYAPETYNTAPQTYSAPQAQYNSPSLSSLYKAPEPQPAYQVYSTPAPVQQYSGFTGYSTEAAYRSFNQINTEAPSYRSQSYPGKLSLNRSPDGFSYTFNTS